MTVRNQILELLQNEDINFLLTNRLPRRLATQLVGWISRIERPLVRDAAIGLWRLFADVDLSDAKTTEFRSLHDCFVRELRAGARPIDRDPAVLISPCDAIVGACGTIAGTELLQIKGFPYKLEDLLGEPALIARHRGGRYVTLRLTSGMYHRFHAPHDCRVERVTHIFGDTWNVNPIALRRIEKLFCKNERAVLQTRLVASGHTVTLVPVAAILVAGIRLNFLDVDLRQEGGQTGHAPKTFACQADLKKGDEMGFFQHGSTIIVIAPDGFSLCDNVKEGSIIRMGQSLMRLPSGF